MYSGYYLVDIGDLHYTTLQYDVTIGGQLYTKDNGLMSMDPPKLSNAADRSIFKIKLSDEEMSFAPLCPVLLNSRVRVRGGFYNTTGAAVAPTSGALVERNMPILCEEDMLIIYAGFISKLSYNITVSDGIILDMECSSPMASLDATNLFFTTNRGINQRTTLPDTSFDEATLSGHSQEVLWGKI